MHDILQGHCAVQLQPVLTIAISMHGSGLYFQAKQSNARQDKARRCVGQIRQGERPLGLKNNVSHSKLIVRESMYLRLSRNISQYSLYIYILCVCVTCRKQYFPLFYA